MIRSANSRPESVDRQSLLSIGEAAKICGYSVSWIRKESNEGRIRFFTFGSTHRFYRKADLLERFPHVEALKEVAERKAICVYGRKSTRDKRSSQETQDTKAGLKRQVAKVRKYAEKHYPGQEIIEISEVASGLDCNRRGFREIIRLAIEGKISVLLCSTRERIYRGFADTLDAVLEECGVTVVEVSPDEKDENENSEMAEFIRVLTDMLYVMGSRRYGSRNKKADGLSVDGMRRFVELRAEGYSQPQVCQILNSEGYRLSSGAKLKKDNTDKIDRKKRKLAQQLLGSKISQHQPHLANFVDSLSKTERSKRTKLSDLIKRYQTWCGKVGKIAYNHNTFSNLIKEFCEKRTTTNGARFVILKQC